jgi:anti-sigma-K factor RskA/putative zinc finger protein
MTVSRDLTCDEIRDLAPLFVTGALDPDQMDAVRAHLADCDDAHDEVLQLGEAATALLELAEPAEPSAALKDRLLAAAAADLVAGRPSSVATGGAASVSRAPSPSTAPVAAEPVHLDVERERRRARLATILAAAAVIVAVVLGASNLLLRQDLSTAQAYRTGVEQALALAGQPGSVVAVLSGEGGAVSGLAVVGADGTTQMAMRGLAPTSGSQVYTSWAIVGNAAPVPIGEFTVGGDGVAVTTARAPGAAPGATLALTLEPRTGATTPTLPIVASGVTRAPTS